MGVARVLLLSDTHLGFDAPLRPRVERVRRGPDFFANYDRALAPALRGEVDAVVHGGDVLFRAKVPASLVEAAFRPLKHIADRGVPVFVVPGNHERSRIPYPLLAMHPGVHVFNGPRTFRVELAGLRVAFAGFPYARRVRDRFRELVERTGYRDPRADVSLLCIHHCVEGATVGPSDYTFRDGDDVIRGADLPRDVAAVLSGHIHRHQVLRRHRTPVLYPGSTERTSSAEREETKGFLIIDVDAGGLADWQFRPLPTPLDRLRRRPA